MMDRYEVEQFLYREARLLDEQLYAEWLELWAADGIYWVPAEGEDPERQVSIIYDDRSKLEDRVAYLKGGSLSAASRPELRRVVSNIETGAGDAKGTVEAQSNFVLVATRGAEQQLWCGRAVHRLRPERGGLRLAFKKVLLVNRRQPMPILPFLL